MKKTTAKPVLVRMPEDILEQLDLIAELEHWTRNHTIIEAIKHYIAETDFTR